MPTPKQLLLEHRYDGHLPTDIAAMTQNGTPWREIAQIVSKRTGLTVSHESLRNWYRDESKAGAA